jgi:hypothetical protein
MTEQEDKQLASDIRDLAEKLEGLINEAYNLRMHVSLILRPKSDCQPLAMSSKKDWEEYNKKPEFQLQVHISKSINY